MTAIYFRSLSSGRLTCALACRLNLCPLARVSRAADNRSERALRRAVIEFIFCRRRRRRPPTQFKCAPATSEPARAAEWLRGAVSGRRRSRSGALLRNIAYASDAEACARIGSDVAANTQARMQMHRSLPMRPMRLIGNELGRH